MYIEQIYTGCLSEAAYYIESDGEAAVIDPMRDIQPLVDLARKRNTTIKYILETHFHADFVSGHLDLAKITGAPIIYGPDNRASFKVITAKDGQEFPLGKITLQVLHTPGHTLESVCYLAKDETGKPEAVFTGDTLFVGDVGRPDLSQKKDIYTAEDMAGMLYDSLQSKIMPLPDEVVVYPAHGDGSSCGKNLGKERSSTIGIQKKTNYALLAKSRGEFIVNVTEGLDKPPAYFPINAEINRKGYESLDALMAKALNPLDAEAFEKAFTSDTDTIILDTRNEAAFTAGYIPGSIFIGLDGRFAEWAGILLPFNKPLLLVTEEGKEQESVTRLARVGFHEIGGYLKGGIKAWKAAGKPLDLIIDITAEEAAMDYQFDDNMIVLDVRKPSEFRESHVKKAVNIPLDKLVDPAAYLADVDDRFNLYVHCGSGYRSVIAASLIKRQGFHNLHNILGGYQALMEQRQLPKEKTLTPEPTEEMD